MPQTETREHPADDSWTALSAMARILVGERQRIDNPDLLDFADGILHALLHAEHPEKPTAGQLSKRWLLDNWEELCDRIFTKAREDRHRQLADTVNDVEGENDQARLILDCLAIAFDCAKRERNTRETIAKARFWNSIPPFPDVEGLMAEADANLYPPPQQQKPRPILSVPEYLTHARKLAKRLRQLASAKPDEQDDIRGHAFGVFASLRRHDDGSILVTPVSDSTKRSLLKVYHAILKASTYLAINAPDPTIRECKALAEDLATAIEMAEQAYNTTISRGPQAEPVAPADSQPAEIEAEPEGQQGREPEAAIESAPPRWIGGDSYVVSGSHITLSNNTSTILQVFATERRALQLPDLQWLSGVSDPARHLRTLKKSPGWDNAVKLPGRKGAGGYFVEIEDARNPEK